MKHIIICSVIAAVTSAVILFQYGRKKKRHLPIMTFKELYYDNCLDERNEKSENLIL